MSDAILSQLLNKKAQVIYHISIFKPTVRCQEQSLKEKILLILLYNNSLHQEVYPMLQLVARDYID